MDDDSTTHNVTVTGRQLKWWQEGKRPDYRFSLANERTFLAWIRTALALMAAAVGIDQFATHLGSPLMREILAGSFFVAGAVLVAFAYRRWIRNERAMRNDADMPRSNMLLLLALFVVAMAFVMMVVAHAG